MDVENMVHGPMVSKTKFPDGDIAIQIRNDLNTARKNNNRTKVRVLGVVLGEIQSKGHGYSKYSIPKEEFYSIIKKIIENNTETAKSLRERSVRDLGTFEFVINEKTDAYKAYELELENEVLSEYLPKYLSRDEIASHINNIDLTQTKSVGQSIGLAMKYFKSANLPVDGNLVKEVLNERYRLLNDAIGAAN